LPPSSNAKPRSTPLRPQGGGAKRKVSVPKAIYEDDDYDLDDDFIDNTPDSSGTPNLDLNSYLKNLGFFSGPTSLATYRGLDPHYDPKDMEGFEDDGDDCVEVNSFTDHIAMDAKTIKSAIEEDKREREVEKRMNREEAAKKKRSNTTNTGNINKKKKTN